MLSVQPNSANFQSPDRFRCALGDQTPDPVEVEILNKCIELLCTASATEDESHQKQLFVREVYAVVKSIREYKKILFLDQNYQILFELISTSILQIDNTKRQFNLLYYHHNDAFKQYIVMIVTCLKVYWRTFLK
jgi:hypothetical protein